MEDLIMSTACKSIWVNDHLTWYPLTLPGRKRFADWFEDIYSELVDLIVSLGYKLSVSTMFNISDLADQQQEDEVEDDTVWEALNGTLPPATHILHGSAWTFADGLACAEMLALPCEQWWHLKYIVRIRLWLRPGEIWCDVSALCPSADTVPLLIRFEVRRSYLSIPMM
jgi:hypothetical protein